MGDPMIDFFWNYGFMQNALLGGVLMAILCALLGTFLVLRRLSLLGDGFAHLAFGGIAIGLLAGIEPLISALAVTTIGALGLPKIMEQAKVYGDSATAVILTFGMGIAVVLIGLVKGFNVNLFSYLFGSLLAISPTDLLIMGAVFVLVLAFIKWKYAELLFTTFDTDLAHTAGVRTSGLTRALTVLTAIVVVLAVRVVGILLVTGLLVIPALIALQLARSFKQTLLIAAGVSLASVLAGIIAAYYLDLPPGGTVVVLLCIVFFCATGLTGLHGQAKPNVLPH